MLVFHFLCRSIRDKIAQATSKFQEEFAAPYSIEIQQRKPAKEEAKSREDFSTASDRFHQFTPIAKPTGQSQLTGQVTDTNNQSLKTSQTVATDLKVNMEGFDENEIRVEPDLPRVGRLNLRSDMYGIDHDKLMKEVVNFKRKAADRSYKLPKDSSHKSDARTEDKMAFSKDSLKPQMKVRANAMH